MLNNAPTKSSLWENWEDKQSNLFNKNIAEKRRKGGGTFELAGCNMYIYLDCGLKRQKIYDVVETIRNLHIEWRTGKSGLRQSIGLQRVRYDFATEQQH